MRTPVLFCWSGGKDSALALHSLLQNPRYGVRSLLTTVTEGFDRISMHGVRRGLLHRQAQSIGLPLEEVFIPPNCDNRTYEARMAAALERSRERGVFHVAFGDIFLEDLRAYREAKLQQLGMTALFPIWKIDSRELVARFLRERFRAITVCIDARKLDPSFVGRELDDRFFRELPPSIDPCGENGEFHTFVLAGPILQQPVPIRIGPVVERDCFVFCDLLPTSGFDSVSPEAPSDGAPHPRPLL